MTIEVRVGAAARLWIRREATYLREQRLSAARSFRRAMRQAQKLLSEQPRAGVSGLLPESRMLVIGAYLLSYRLVRGDDGGTITAVEIFAVRHSRQSDARHPSS
jgi:plasmid stabilization system protein ParE